MVWKKKLSVFGGCDTHPVMLREIMDEILKIRQEIYELNENELSYPVEDVVRENIWLKNRAKDIMFENSRFVSLPNGRDVFDIVINELDEGQNMYELYIDFATSSKPYLDVANIVLRKGKKVSS